MNTTCHGGEARPLGKIVAVGRNFADHAKEMGAEPPSEPMLFLKPSTACTVEPGAIVLPPWSSDVHHEVELVVRVGQRARSVSVRQAREQIDAYGVGLDLTARDVQARAKKAGHPWAVAKGFDGSAPISRLRPLSDEIALDDLDLRCEVGGPRQAGNTRQMIFSVEELVAFASTRFTLEPGDLIFCGTPEGVGPLRAGDRVRAEIRGHCALECDVVAG